MAIYESVCKECKKRFTYRQPIVKRNETPKCCGKPTERQLSAPMGYVDRPAAG